MLQRSLTGLCLAFGLLPAAHADSPRVLDVTVHGAYHVNPDPTSPPDSGAVILTFDGCSDDQRYCEKDGIARFVFRPDARGCIAVAGGAETSRLEQRNPAGVTIGGFTAVHGDHAICLGPDGSISTPIAAPFSVVDGSGPFHGTTVSSGGITVAAAPAAPDPTPDAPYQVSGRFALTYRAELIARNARP